MNLYDDIERAAFQDLREHPQADWWNDGRPSAAEAATTAYEAHRALSEIRQQAPWDSHEDYRAWLKANPEEPF